MGEVAVVYQIMPESPEVDLEKLKQEIERSIPKRARLNNIIEKPIAFGLKALEVQIILNDREGGADEIEEQLGNIDHVQSVETIQVGLL